MSSMLRSISGSFPFLNPIDAETNSLNLDLDSAELDARRNAWTAPTLKVTQGT